MIHQAFPEEAARDSTAMPARTVPTALPERAICAGAGGALVWFGLTRRGVLGTLAAVTGSALLTHGLASRSRAYGLLDVQARDDGAASITQPIHFRESITINREPAEVYRRWRRLEELPRFMLKVESVQVLDEGRSRWTVAGPGPNRRAFEWEALLTEDRENELIAWSTVDEGPLQHEGSVRFVPAPAGRGTRVTVEMTYRPKGGVLAAAALKALGHDPKGEAREDLRRFKQLVETGELADESSPSARQIHHDRGALDRKASRERGEREEVDEALMESFPASDPPAFTPGHA